MRDLDLKNEWQTLWKGLRARGDGQAAIEELLSRYAEAHRAYHSIAHIEDCLSELTAVSELVPDLDAIRFAIWYHDAVYDTQAKDNEERSAALAVETARGAGLADSFSSLVERLILATKHTVPPTGFSAQILVDIDLSVLGKPEVEFDNYERQIRLEYSWVSDEMFAKGRSAILSSFLSRPSIYSTDELRGKFEEKARLNLTRSIARLSQRD